MRWNDGDIDLDADEFDPDDYEAIDFTNFDLEMEESLKDLDLSFPVPDLSDCEVTETAAAWVKSPRLMLETLTFRLNEILALCEAKNFPGTVIQLKPKYIYTDEEKKHPTRAGLKLILLTGASFVLLDCGHIVDIVNMIQPTPFKGEIFVELGKCMHRGETPEFDRSIESCKQALTKLAVWIKTKEIQNGAEPNEPSEAPRTIWSILTQLLRNRTQIEETNVGKEVAEPTMPSEETLALRNEVESGPDAGVVRNTMRRLTKGWRIEYGNEARDVELVGFDYIAQLVNAAGNEVSTDRLLGIENEPALANDRHSPQPLWDDPARKAVNDRIQQLEADIERFCSECNEAKEENNDLAFDESNKARMKAFDELNELHAQKREAIGKSGRMRELNRPNRKAHDNLRKRIDGAREHLKAKGLLMLHRHFVEFIQPNGKGSAYKYCPEPKVEWTVIFHVE